MGGDLELLWQDGVKAIPVTVLRRRQDRGGILRLAEQLADARELAHLLLEGRAPIGAKPRQDTPQEQNALQESLCLAVVDRG